MEQEQSFIFFFGIAFGIIVFFASRMAYYRKKYRKLKKQVPNEFVIFSDLELDLTFEFLRAYHEKNENYERAAKMRDLHNSITFRANSEINE